MLQESTDTKGTSSPKRSRVETTSEPAMFELEKKPEQEKEALWLTKDDTSGLAKRQAAQAQASVEVLSACVFCKTHTLSFRKIAGCVPQKAITSLC